MNMGRFTHLLDTNILSDLVRHPAGKIAQRIRELEFWVRPENYLEDII